MSNPSDEVMEVLIKGFESWEYLEKARKPKGLDQWKKLLPLSEKLMGKKSNHITFTCQHPSHETPKQHSLGSNEGNLHFLMGYGNPGFHLAPYHMQIIDPNLSEEDAGRLAKNHPSNPAFWEGEVFVEGDKQEGKPNPAVKAQIKAIRREKLDKFQVKENTSTYTAIPVEGIIYADQKDIQYSWDLVKDSFFSTQNPEMTDAMNLVASLKEVRKAQEAVYNVNIPDEVTYLAGPWKDKDFVKAVYPLVRSKFPTPGSVIPITAENEETLYAVVTNKSLEFYDRNCNIVSVRAYDRWYDSFSLVKGGNIHPSVLLNFTCGHLGIMRDDISVFSHRESK